MNITALAILAVWILSAADHYTTYLMLSTPTPGWTVWEANPVAKWLFDTFGLGLGLTIDTIFTFVAGLWAYQTQVVFEEFKIVCCLVVCAGTGYAVYNNVQVLYTTGVW